MFLEVVNLKIWSGEMGTVKRERFYNEIIYAFPLTSLAFWLLKLKFSICNKFSIYRWMSQFVIFEFYFDLIWYGLHG